MIDAFCTSGTSPTSEKESGPDFLVENHFTIFLLKPLTPAGNSWISDHLPEDRMTFGGAVVVEPRYIWAILAGLQDDGLTAVPQ